jgi:hypothetical protein
MQDLTIIGATISMRSLPTEHFVSTSQKTMGKLFLWKPVMENCGVLLAGLVMEITMESELVGGTKISSRIESSARLKYHRKTILGFENNRLDSFSLGIGLLLF